MMFARTAFRTAQSAASPMKLVTSRRYSTAPPSGGGSNPVVLGAVAVAVAAGGYYVYASRGGSEGVAAKAEDAVKTAAAAATGAAAGAEKPATEAAAAAAKVAFTGGDQGFIALTLTETEAVNHNTKRLRFALPAADQTAGLPTASALLTKFTPAAAAAEGEAAKEGEEEKKKPKAVIRPYTPVSDTDTVGYLDLLVKRYEGGAMSSHIHSLQPGDALAFKGPIIKYPWAANKHEHVVLVAGGTGIAPMYQLIRAVFSDAGVAAGDRTRVTLVYGNIGAEDILLRDELAALENTFPQRFRAFHVLEKPPADWTGETGYISKALLQQVAPEPRSGATADAFKIFVCGPPPMMKAISGPKKSPSDQGELGGILAELGYSKEQVLKF